MVYAWAMATGAVPCRSFCDYSPVSWKFFFGFHVGGTRVWAFPPGRLPGRPYLSGWMGERDNIPPKKKNKIIMIIIIITPLRKV